MSQSEIPPEAGETEASEPGLAPKRLIDSQTQKRSWWQFGLRTILLVMIPLSIGMGWFGWRLQQAKEQRLAVEFIRKCGGTVWYEHQLNNQSHYLPPEEPWIPNWLLNALGEDFFFRVQNVDSGDFDDATLLEISKLKSVQRIAIIRSRITNEGLKHLEDLPHLNFLAIDVNKTITDQAMANIAKLDGLKKLSLTASEISDESIEELAEMTNLKTIHLDYSKVSKDGVRRLRQALPEAEISGGY